MALASRVLSVAAAAGLDEATRPELLEPGSAVLRSENERFDLRGGRTRRLGFGPRTANRYPSGSRTSGFRVVGSRRQTFVVDDAGQVDVWSEGQARWATRGRLPEATASVTMVESTGGAVPRVQDMVLSNGLWVILHRSGDPLDLEQYLLVSIVDRDGASIRSAEVVASATSTPVAEHGIHGWLVTHGDLVYLVVEDIGTASIVGYVLDTSTPAQVTNGWGSIGVLANDRETSNRLPAVSVVGVTGGAVLAYVKADPLDTGDKVGVVRFDASGPLETQDVQATELGSAEYPTKTALSYDAASGWLWLVFDQWEEVTAAITEAADLTQLSNSEVVLTLTVTSPQSTPAYLAVMSLAGGTSARIFAEDTDFLSLVTEEVETDNQTVQPYGVGNAIRYRNVHLGTLPFVYGGRIYALAYPGSDYASGAYSDANSQRMGVVCEIPVSTSTADGVNWLRPVANLAPGLAEEPLARHAQVTVDGGKAYLPLGVRRTATYSAATIVELDFADPLRWLHVEHGGSEYFSAGVLSCADGVTAHETGFLARPSTPRFTVDTGNRSPAVGYRWLAIYEAIDSDGNVTWSAPSPPSESSGAQTSKKFLVRTRPIGLTNRIGVGTATSPSVVSVTFYRTTDGGGLFFRIGSVDAQNDAAEVEFEDNISDAVIAQNALLYRQPGVPGTALERWSPPGFSVVTSYNGMLVGWSGSDIWWSGQTVRGEGVWFNPAFQVPVDESEPGTALAVQDGTLYAFTRRSVFALAGEAPSDNGAGGLGLPRRVSADVGCIDPRSVVATSEGVFFQSERGIELLTRGQAVQFIGEAVRQTMTAYPVVTSATMDRYSGLVRFTCATSEGGAAGVHIVYDIVRGTWVSVDHVRGATASKAAASACMVPGDEWRFAWLESNGVLHVERRPGETGAYLDGTAWIPRVWETPSFKMGLQQEQRLWSSTLLFERESAAGLSVEVGHDYGAYVSADDKAWTEGETDGRRQVEWRPRSRGQAIRFRVSDTPPATLGSGKGLTFVGLSVDIAPKQGTTRGTPRLDTTVRR